MPLVRLEVRQGRSATQKQALLDAAHAALVKALEIPDQERMQRIVEHTRADFELPPGRSDNFVLVEVMMFASRSRQAKRRLYQLFGAQLRRIGRRPGRCLRGAARAAAGQLGHPRGPDGQRGGRGVRDSSLTSLTTPQGLGKCEIVRFQMERGG